MSVKTSGGLTVEQSLHDFIVNEALPGTGISVDDFFNSMANIIEALAPKNQALMDQRDELQAKIDAWHNSNTGPIDPVAYKQFLSDIGYLQPVVEDFSVNVSKVDAEIASVAGPQLVVPVNNARYALNAANARWGSLYDALYGTDAISEEGGAERGGAYNAIRGQRVVAEANALLDASMPLAQGSYGDVNAYSVIDGALRVTLESGSEVGLKDPSQCVGYLGTAQQPSSVLLCNNGLHAEIVIDKSSLVGQSSHAGVSDVILESALTTIQDCEDSVAAVDADDKVVVYRNWLGLMKGDLEERLNKGGQEIVRKLNADRHYIDVNGGKLTLPGRSVLLVRNVGTHMMTDAVLDKQGNQVPETYIDALVTSLAAMHDLQKTDDQERNSRTGSVYIVKPKLHGSDEVALSVSLFEKVEQALGLERNTLKMGIMDEERRTSVNLKNCISAARERVIFINTGFLDRTGDEMHTSMNAGVMVPKGEMKNATWLTSYENSNVDVGLECGLQGNGQIGKGMWAIPDQMSAMLAAKQAHPEAGANTAWVPSPTAATLHATHYQSVLVSEVQDQLKSRKSAEVDSILEIPLSEVGRNYSDDDINNVGLMEDRATLRISSQFLANWIHHGIIDQGQVRDAMERMALVVDKQNAGDPDYSPMAPDFDTDIAFQAALDLVLLGREQANGYTEFLLTERRRQVKAKASN